MHAAGVLWTTSFNLEYQQLDSHWPISCVEPRSVTTLGTAPQWEHVWQHSRPCWVRTGPAAAAVQDQYWDRSSIGIRQVSH
jgi:hypothetical protein